MKTTEQLIRNYSDEFDRLVELDVKGKTTKEQEDFLFKNIHLWEVAITSLYSKICNDLSIGKTERDYFMCDDDIVDSLEWKQRATRYKSILQKRVQQVKLLVHEHNRKTFAHENGEQLKVLNEILKEIKSFKTIGMEN